MNPRGWVVMSRPAFDHGREKNLRYHSTEFTKAGRETVARRANPGREYFSRRYERGCVRTWIGTD